MKISKYLKRYQYIYLSINLPKVLIIFLLFSFCSLLLTPHTLAAMPSSTNYKIQEYSFGSGGLNNGTSTNFQINGIAGEVEFGRPSSTNFKAGSGLTFMMTANLPPAPTITNPDNYYNKLNLIVATGSNSSDTQFALAIQNSSDDYATTKYVQADHTLGQTAVWQTNSVWGASGFDIIGLTPGLTYRASVAARQGTFTQTGFGPTAQAATNNPSFGFSLDTNTVPLQLNPGSVTTSAIIETTIVTNGTGGAIIYVYGTNNGLLSSSTNYTIGTSNDDLSSISEGYGIQGNSVVTNSGGPMEILSPYNGSAQTIGIVNTAKRAIFDSSSQPVDGKGRFTIKAKASSLTKAANDYADIITVIGSATF